MSVTPPRAEGSSPDHGAHPRVLAFDLGQGALRARVRSRGAIECEFTGPGYQPGQPIERFLLDLVTRATALSGESRFDVVVGGLTGVHGRSPDSSQYIAPLAARHGTRRLILADDSVTSYLGARGDTQGAMAAVGTGLVALGYKPRRATARVDGTGAMLGDEGSGWWIGRQGLIAAISAADGRRPNSKALLAAATEQFGPIEDLPGRVIAAASPIALVADFAPAVAEAARHGDPVARQIWARAGEHIATALSAAATRADLRTECDYSLLGGVAAAVDLLEPALTQRLHEDFPECTRTEPIGTSLDGAERLTGLNTIDPLLPLASEAHAPRKDNT